MGAQLQNRHLTAQDGLTYRLVLFYSKKTTLEPTRPLLSKTSPDSVLLSRKEISPSSSA